MNLQCKGLESSVPHGEGIQALTSNGDLTKQGRLELNNDALHS